MKWKGRRQSKNVEDRQLEDLPDIKDGEIMFGTGEVYHPDNPKMKKERADMKVVKEVAKLGKTKPIPTPTPRPKITQTQVTPGEWKTKSK